ncbi:MAG: hypothetical protein JRL30_17320 [Deltaproteobacteria bacterium]|nr:hypothetical protein [Deltaproteobacteria bacterium]
MKKPFETIIRAIVDRVNGNRPLSGLAAADQFRPEKKREGDVARNLNAAFLISLSGPEHPLYDRATRYLETLRRDSRWSEIADFYTQGIQRVVKEISAVCHSNKIRQDALNEAASWCMHANGLRRDEAREKIWRLFFPEGAWCLAGHEERIRELRKSRHVQIKRLNPEPVHDPARQILFMSNLLISTPHDMEDIHRLPYGAHILRELKQVAREKQRYWYDHPIQIGVKNENNEAIYGLRGLDQAIAFEKARGMAKPDDRITCLLSVSVTHNGLHRVVRDYLTEVYAGIEPLLHLKVYVFSEIDTLQILEHIILPAQERYLGISDGDLLTKIFGVDGEYGRHYSFLKALSAYWQVLIDASIRGSFKLDLDQVFDEKVLVAETGQSALEHFLTPLWGAEGTEVDGGSVELGMMAGALVNEKDIGHGLFTPDVPIPDPIPDGEAAVFFSPLPMAISTRAEMMARYDNKPLNGRTTCLQRIHVTGGTSAALVNSIRTHRPFTPTFIGRAEDQAYLLCCLFKDPRSNLRYLHKPGLIMRHDKEVFAGQAIEGAKLGKVIGDLARILLFTYYARALPWPQTETKKIIDPFTGCFVSDIPFTLVYLRLGLRLLESFARSNPADEAEGLKLMTLAVDRLQALIRNLDETTPNPLGAQYQEEKRGWDIFYDILDRLEEGLATGDDFAMSLRRKARELVKECRVEVGGNRVGA